MHDYDPDAPIDHGVYAFLESILQVSADVLGGVSDVHFRRDRRVWVRDAGKFTPLPDSKPIPAAVVDEIKRFIGPVNTVRTIPMGGHRWRSLVLEDGTVHRRVPTEPPPLKKLGLPDAIASWIDLPEGLIVVAGQTGSGKSTTIAALLAQMIRRRRVHLLTIEDPMEYLLPDGLAMVTQQEIPASGHKAALESAMRADPDVVMFGECRVREHFDLCLQLAATGHLVFTTIHAGDSRTVCERIDSMGSQGARSLMAATLRGVCCQRLLPDAKVQGRLHCATEVMLVKKDIQAVLRPGGDLFALQTKVEETPLALNRTLTEMVLSGKITQLTAETATQDPDRLNSYLAEHRSSSLPER